MNLNDNPEHTLSAYRWFVSGIVHKEGITCFFSSLMSGECMSSLAGTSCPIGTFCAGGSSQPEVCQSSPGQYCGIGSVSTNGVECPVGFYCTGGAANKIPCTSAAGFFCPRCSYCLICVACILSISHFLPALSRNVTKIA